MTLTQELARQIIEAYAAGGLKIAAAESCTGGLVSAALTEIAGSSAVLERGFVTYSNEAKIAMLNVDEALISNYGAVSAQVAIAMAEGALVASLADVAVSITGIAGPGGGSLVKPVGLVHFGLARRGKAMQHVERRFGDIGRAQVRMASVNQALDLLLTALR